MNLINCGERSVNKRFRIVITDIAREHGIKEGDRVEVFIKKVDWSAKNESGDKEIHA
jgi:bifunctional DNA-binding transcriptional regulator/antitoxin component of YhaV-PrlF toxin-antitoxin module